MVAVGSVLDRSKCLDEKKVVSLQTAGGGPSWIGAESIQVFRRKKGCICQNRWNSPGSEQMSSKQG